MKKSARILSRSMLLLTVFLLLPVLVEARISDRYLGPTVEKYFARDRTAPTLLSVEVIDDFLYGRTLKIRMRGHRNQENTAFGFAFGAAASVANQADIPIETIWVELDVRYKYVETSIAVAPADCSIEAIVKKQRSFGFWWKNCLEFL
jgi:hypothetical protein